LNKMDPLLCGSGVRRQHGTEVVTTMQPEEASAMKPEMSVVGIA
jgi:hypothetical protein